MIDSLSFSNRTFEQKYIQIWPNMMNIDNVSLSKSRQDKTPLPWQ